MCVLIYPSVKYVDLSEAAPGDFVRFPWWHCLGFMALSTDGKTPVGVFLYTEQGEFSPNYMDLNTGTRHSLINYEKNYSLLVDHASGVAMEDFDAVRTPGALVLRENEWVMPVRPPAQSFNRGLVYNLSTGSLDNLRTNSYVTFSKWRLFLGSLGDKDRQLLVTADLTK